MLAAGAVHLTTVRLLAPHLNPGNHCEVLESARGKTKPEVEKIVARLSPRPDVPPSVRKLPAMATAPPPAQVLPAAAPAPALTLPLPARPAVVAPLSPDRYKLELTIGDETLGKLRLAKDMLGHAIPSGGEAAILDRALTVLLEDLAKKKFADTRKPRPSRGTKPRARYIAAAVKRAVWLRDLGRCAFVGTSGHRCNERRFLQFHHLDPYALGGEASVDQIALRCRSHNDYEGRLYFGKRRSGDRSARVREEAAPYASRGAQLGVLVPEQVDGRRPDHQTPRLTSAGTTARGSWWSQ
jgi:hypothetical protein